jgi:hypothetical protein
MITVDVTVSDGCLRLDCAGLYGPASEGNLACGELVRETIRRYLDGTTEPLSEVVIDFTRVEYGAMDGPIWSVLPAVRRGLKVTYLVGERNREALRVFAVTMMDRLIGVVDADDSHTSPSVTQ